MSGLPKFTPVLIGGQPGPAHGETVMDLEVAHAIAPDARLVVVNALPTVTGDGAYEKIGQHVRVGGSPVSWRGVEPVDRMGVRSSAQRGRPRSRTVCPGQRPHTWHGRLRRQRRHGRSGVQRRRGLVDPAGPERYRRGRGRLAAGDDVGRRHHPVDRPPGAVALRRRPGPTCRCPRAPAAASRRCSPAPHSRGRYRRPAILRTASFPTSPPSPTRSRVCGSCTNSSRESAAVPPRPRRSGPR